VTPVRLRPASRRHRAGSLDRDEPYAVVIGFDHITGLQTARILAERGVPVLGVASDGGHFACRSSAPEAVAVCDTRGPGLVDCLEALAARLRHPPVLVPCSDESVLRIARSRERLDPVATVVQPAPEVVELLLDKVAFARHAEAVGLPVPVTRVVSDRATAAAAARELTFPCIAKPAGKSATWDAVAGAKVVRVESPAALLELYDRVEEVTTTVVVQEWVEGPDSALLSCNGYFRCGEPIATFVARKLRQWPPRQGTSCLGEEVRDDEVLRATVDLFGSVGFHGLGYVEMKRDVRTGRALIIEPNVGRPTGRSAIAEAGGVELLLAMYRDAIGRPLPEGLTQTYRGAKWVHIARDVPSAWFYWRRGELTLGQWRRSLSGPKTDAVWSRQDPRPFLAQIGRDVSAGAAGLRRRVSASRRRPAPPLRQRR
jgi:D-aspartate ligase